MLATKGHLVCILATAELLFSSVNCHLHQASTSHFLEIQAQPVPALPLNLNIYHGFEPHVIVVSSSSNTTSEGKFKKHASGAKEPDEASDMDGSSAADTQGGASTETKNDYTNRVIKKTATGEEYECPLGEYTPFCSECGGPATEFVFDGHWMSTCLGLKAEGGKFAGCPCMKSLPKKHFEYTPFGTTTEEVNRRLTELEKAWSNVKNLTAEDIKDWDGALRKNKDGK